MSEEIEVSTELSRWERRRERRAQDREKSLWRYFKTKLEMQVAMDFRSDLVEHCLTLSQAYHDDAGVGMFMYQINFEAHNAGRVVVALPPLLQSALTVIGMFIVTYQLSSSLAVL